MEQDLRNAFDLTKPLYKFNKQLILNKVRTSKIITEYEEYLEFFAQVDPKDIILIQYKIFRYGEFPIYQGVKDILIEAVEFLKIKNEVNKCRKNLRKFIKLIEKNSDECELTKRMKLGYAFYFLSKCFYKNNKRNITYQQIFYLKKSAELGNKFAHSYLGILYQNQEPCMEYFHKNQNDIYAYLQYQGINHYIKGIDLGEESCAVYSYCEEFKEFLGIENNITEDIKFRLEILLLSKAFERGVGDAGIYLLSILSKHKSIECKNLAIDFLIVLKKIGYKKFSGSSYFTMDDDSYKSIIDNCDIFVNYIINLEEYYENQINEILNPNDGLFLKNMKKIYKNIFS
jgi:hypothetical protein